MLGMLAGLLAGGSSVADVLGAAGPTWGFLFSEPNLGTNLLGCVAHSALLAGCVVATSLVPELSCLPGTIWSPLYKSGVDGLFVPTSVGEGSCTVLSVPADGVTDLGGMCSCLLPPDITDDAHCSWVFGIKHFAANDSRTPQMEGRR